MQNAGAQSRTLTWTRDFSHNTSVGQILSITKIQEPTNTMNVPAVYTLDVVESYKLSHLQRTTYFGIQHLTQKETADARMSSSTK